MPSYRALSLSVAACAMLSGCMIVPQTTTTHDPACAMVRKRISLAAQEVEVLGICRNNAECSGLLAVYGVVAAASAVVSGSIALVGNVAYWLEEQGQCQL